MTMQLVPTVARFFPEAAAAVNRPLVSHRSREFELLYRETIDRLSALGGSGFLPLLAAGTGTWANECMVWNFSCRSGRTLIVSNGEFGRRLHAQSQVAAPECDLCEFEWGKPFDEEVVESFFTRGLPVGRIFAVACETSFGCENNLAMLDRVAARHGAWIGVDAVSAVGVTPELFRYPRIDVVTGSSGKALAALPGIALLWYRPTSVGGDCGAIADSLRLDALIAAAESPGGVRNTLSSLTLGVLHAGLGALAGFGFDRYRARLLEQKRRIIAALAAVGISAVAGSDSPIVTAFHRPPEPAWRQFSAALAAEEVELYTQPRYLAERGLFEIALMGDYSEQQLGALFRAIGNNHD